MSKTATFDLEIIIKCDIDVAKEVNIFLNYTIYLKCLLQYNYNQSVFLHNLF